MLRLDSGGAALSRVLLGEPWADDEDHAGGEVEPDPTLANEDTRIDETSNDQLAERVFAEHGGSE